MKDLELKHLQKNKNNENNENNENIKKSKLIGGGVLRTNNKSKIYTLYENIKSHSFSEDVNISTEYSKYINNLHILLNMYPMPLNNDLNNKTYFINGGIKYGGRYPDIIINKNDIEYGIAYFNLAGVIINDNMTNNITKIVKYVQTLYFTDN